MSGILPGANVIARTKRHVVVDVEEHENCRSVRLAAIEGGGEAITLLHPFDRIDVLPAADRPKRAGRRRVARACAAAVRASYEAGQTRTLVDARVRLLPYQIEPALAILRGEATRVLLADEVGLGKTIQAGLILSELRARQMLRRALILTPAGLREQWASELRGRFDLETTIMDAGTLGALQRSLPPWVNPWTLPGIALASIDLLKRDELLPQLEHIVWDVVVVDEAHHATGGTDRWRLAALACSRARFVVLITATPHNGDRSAFDELRRIGSLGTGEQPLRIFRRSRADVDARSVARRTRLIRVRRTRLEVHVHRLLRSYTAQVWHEAGADGRLAMVVLRKRALSGAASLARSIARRLEGLRMADPPGNSEAQLSLKFTDTLGGELIEDDREPGRELSGKGLADVPTERQLLVELLEAARLAQRHDSKAAKLVVSLLACREPVIVFTEYRDTLEELWRRLQPHLAVSVLHGAMMPSQRQRSVDALENGDVRVLLATDAAAEGLNLQHRCRWLIHYEVPWSPVRIEQRNGRVDRIGQSRRVHAWHLVAKGTEEEDVLARLAARSLIAARDLGDQQLVAAVVFGDRPLVLPARATPRRSTEFHAGAAEASRVTLLRRLPVQLSTATRPLRAGRRCGPVIGVVRAAVLDPRARLVASTCAAARGPALIAAEGAAAKALGRTGRRSIAVHRSFVRAVRLREAAIRHAFATSTTSLLQPSLFDRHAVIEAEHRRRERERALAELAREPNENGPCTIRLSLIGAFSV
jgi:ERCC4-related helicase